MPSNAFFRACYWREIRCHQWQLFHQDANRPYSGKIVKDEKTLSTSCVGRLAMTMQYRGHSKGIAI